VAARALRVLIVEDAPADAELCRRELARAGLEFTAQCVDREIDFERALAEFVPDLILSDFSMPTAFDGLTALDMTRAISPDIPFVFVSGTIGEDRAVEAMRRGATDYVLKDRLGRLGLVVKRALQEAEERRARRKAEEESKLQGLRIGRLNRILAVLSGINAAIVRMRERQQLFEEACRIAVEHGGFGAAWIGRYEAAAREVVAVAGAGLPADSVLLSGRLVLCDGPPRNRGLIAQTIEARRPVFCNDIAREPEAGGERRAEAIRRGYRSAIALPLTVEGAVVGTLALFAREADFFDDEEVKLLTELADDISFALDHIAKEEKLNYLAYYDVLTGLPNRTLFKDRLEQRLAAARRAGQVLSVMMLDIERFRRINDTLGRQCGDELLRAFSSRLAQALGESDALAYVGGDYFTVATRHVHDTADVVRLLEHVLGAVATPPYAVGGSDLRIAARAGVVLYPSDGVDAEGLLKNAEAALKDAKRTGNRYLFYAPQMNARVAEQLKLENDLRRAVQEGEFVLYYQPRVDLAAARLCGFEALIRWAHPQRGLVSPGEFIPVLEATGLILEVGRWALRRAARDHAAWREAGLNPPRIAVNVSAVQLRRRQFIEEVREALAESGGFRHIDIEITESMLMEDIEGNIGKLKALQEMGVNVALDDFGTGYCSLAYLAKLPINSLKVDRSFVAPMAHGAEQMAIVSTIVSLAHALNLKVCAEGVETQEQANLLRLLRCDEVQGFFFARPGPEAQAVDSLKQGGG